MLLTPEKDPMGQAIHDYYHGRRVYRLVVCSPDFDNDEIPVAQLFRTYAQMPVLEQTALSHARGRVLDVGAGSGCHSLALKGRGIEAVESIDISPLAVEVMQAQGLNATARDFFDRSWGGTYDTILMLMNGIGIVGRLEALPDFFDRLKQLLAPDGVVLLDSTDLRYLYEEEDRSFLLNMAGDYYGELAYSMRYGATVGDDFRWLYIDRETLAFYAEQCGFSVEILREGAHYDYLAKLFLR